MSEINETLRQELLQMQAQDQEMRKTVMARFKMNNTIDPNDSRWWSAVDTANTGRMKQMIAEVGFPRKSLVGKDGAFAAWLLVQHADKDPEFQKQCLEMMRAAVRAGEASAKHFAYLTDRVRLAFGQPQIYGTQMHFVDGNYVPREIEDEVHVDERRKSVGLEPLAEYIKRFG